jgi:phosphohistidine phosphatase
MKTLILARHAKSDWNHPELSDHDRPLNKRGRTDAPRMAAFLAAHYPPPQRVVSSTAVRANTTAEILAAAFGHAATDIQHAARLYLADVQTLLSQARALDDHDQTVMLVGHNPGMTDFLNRLTDAGIDNLPTCGVARVAFDVARWAELAPGQGRLLSLDVPNSLGSE